MRNILFITLLSLLSTMPSYGEGGNGEAAVGGIVIKEAILARELPNDYDAFLRARTSGVDRTDARHVLLLLSQTRKRLDKMRAIGPYRNDTIFAYVTAWDICLKLHRTTESEAIRKEILDEWNRGLVEDNREVILQLAAVPIKPSMSAAEWPWVRELFTSGFWRLFEETKNPDTLKALCATVLRYARVQDIVLLEKKRDALAEGELRTVIQRTLNWVVFELQGDKEFPPAQPPPAIEIK